MNVVFEFLAANQARLELPNLGPVHELTYVLHTPRFRTSSHVVFLILRNSELAAVAKVPRIAGATAAIEREVENLRRVQGLRPNGFGSVPRVIAFEDFRACRILLETAVPGELMDRREVRRDFSGCCSAGVEWLTHLHQASITHDEALSRNAYVRMVDESLQSLARLLPPTGSIQQLLDETHVLSQRLRERRFPLVFEHGDFTQPNILRQRDGRIGVVDWELAEPHGLPACDLFFFLAYAAFARVRASRTPQYVKAFHAAFFGPRAWARPYVLRYMHELGLSPEIVAPLFVLTWARYVENLARRVLANSTSPGGASVLSRWLEENRFFAIWRESVRHASHMKLAA